MNMRKNVLGALMVAVLFAIAPSGVSHDGDGNTADGADIGGLGLLWYLEAEDDHHHHYEVFVLNINGEDHNGVLVEIDHEVVDSGVHLHDACIMHDFDIGPDLLEAYEDAGFHAPYYPYDYIVASPDAVGFNDEGAIEMATWFWAQHGISIHDHHALEDFCGDGFGGEFVHADLILHQEDHGH